MSISDVYSVCMYIDTLSTTRCGVAVGLSGPGRQEQLELSHFL